MTNNDSAFVQGMLKQAEAIDQENEKQAYGKRLTALLQRKGKLPTTPNTSKPAVGASSFPKQAGFANGLAVAGGALGGLGTGLTASMPGLTTAAGGALGGLAGYMTGGDEDPAKSHRGRNALLGALAGAGAGYGVHQFSKNVTEPWIRQQGMQMNAIDLPASLTNFTDMPKTANEELLSALQSYLSQAQEGIGQGVEKVRDLAHDGKDMLGRAGLSAGSGATSAVDFAKNHPWGSTAIGAGAGGLAGALSGKSEDKETGEKGTRGRNALLGSLLGGGAGFAAHEYGVQPAEQALHKARTSGIDPKPAYSPEYGQGGQPSTLALLKQLGLAPLNVSQNAPPSSLTLKPRF